MAKQKIENMVIEELLNYEKASSLIASYYANNIRLFSDSDDALSYNQGKFSEFNEMHSMIMACIEDKLRNEL